jgi:GNAT superfamily N-acetyltransferase
LISALDYVHNKFDVFEHYNVDHYLYGVGLCINSDYRGRGIATELLKARKPFLQSLGLKVTSTLFTTLGSQKAATYAGYEEKSVTSYEEIQLKFPDMDFSHANAEHCKTLALTI